MVKAKKWVLAKLFDGEPKDSNFRLEEEDLPAPKEGEFICEALYLSVDPYMRAFCKETNKPVLGEQVAKVTESRNKDYPVGCLVQLHSGWRTRSLVKPENFTEMLLAKLPDIGKREPSIALGVAGMPGVTAYFGFLEVCRPKEGEVVLVNGAAGAVGSIVGQIAKIKGCKVIGFAGTKEKCDWVKSLGFDHVFNYREVDVDKALNEAAPDGIDCYYDNVGGAFSSKAIQHMRLKGRVAICGAISTYNDADAPKLPFPFITILTKQLKVEGILVYNWVPRYPEAKVALLKWINEGKIKYKETIREGFDKMPKTFMDLMKGGNTGKMVVKA